VLRNIWKYTCGILIKYWRQFIIIEQRQDQIDLKNIIYDKQYQCVNWLFVMIALHQKSYY